MKKLNKVIFILLMMITMIMFLIPNEVYADDEIDIFEAGRDFLHAGQATITITLDGLVEQGSKTLGQWMAKGIFESIVDALWAIGLLVIFISTVVLGIKYMFVLPQEKSRLKQATTPYIIGVVIIFGALTIWRFLIIILDGSI